MQYTEDNSVTQARKRAFPIWRGWKVIQSRLFCLRKRHSAALVMRVGLLMVAGLGAPTSAQAVAWASEDRLVTIGVLTITSKEEAKARWNPTADHLSEQIPGTRFEVQPLYLQEMARAVRLGELDFVHLQPLQFVRLRREYGLSALTTRVVDDSGSGIDRFGSAIVRHRDRMEIEELDDLRGSIVAGVAPNALGAWILGMVEIERAGLSVEDDILPLFVGLPMTNVLGAVAAGRADVGIVRADVLARARQAGTFPDDTFVVINPVNQPGYPHPVSTRLVPEWPFAATGRADAQLTEQVRRALLDLTPKARALQSAGLVSWTAPADYDGLESLADRWLTPPQTIRDWLQANWWLIPVVLSVLLAVLLGQQWHARRQLAAREQEHRSALNAMRDAVVTLDTGGRILFLNPAAEKLLPEDMPPQRAIGRHFLDAFALLLRHDQHDFSLGGLYERLNQDGWVHYPVVLGHGQPRRVLDLTAIRMDGQVGRPARQVLVSLTDVTELEEANRQLAFRATHDELSGLLNRRSFVDLVDGSLASRHTGRGEGTLLWVDLDHFRLVNQGVSHRMGDELVRRMASYLSVVLPAGTPIGRLGDDEFGIFLNGVTAAQNAGWAERVLTAIREFRMSGEQQLLRVSASIGARELPRDGNIDAATALQEAESACLLAKRLGGNRLVTYDESEDERTLRQADFAELNRLKDALDRGLFVLHGQEIQSLASDCHGPWLEVLLRLDSGGSHYGSPGPMIELAERFNHMPPVDRWVISNAFEMLGGLLDESGQPPARLTINLSGQSMQDAELVGYVRQELQRTRIRAEWICFEITETAAIANFDRAIELISALRELGARIALDDFGGGLLSFDFLRRLRPDIVKIDGRLVHDLDGDPVAAVIVESIHSVAHVMGAKTVGEWVEGEPTRRNLEQIGVDFAQGYLFHRPQPLSEYLMTARAGCPG